MRKLVILLAALSILAPAGIAAAHHDSQNQRKYSKQYNNDRSQRRSNRRNRFDSSTQAEKDMRSYIDPAYSDYPAWAGLAFSPRGGRR